MNPLKELLRQVAGELNKSAPWALVGGLAVSSRIEPRFTRDLDIAIAVETDTEAEDLVYRFRDAGFGVLALIEQEAAERLATVRLTAPDATGIVVDLPRESSQKSSGTPALWRSLPILSFLSPRCGISWR